MPETRRSLLPLLLAAASGVAGCGSSQPPAEPGVVARIDTLRIRATDVRAFAGKVPAYGDLTSRRQSYLRGLMARHLLEREARSRGLDTLASVVAQVDAQWQGRLRQRYRKDVLWGSLRVTDAQVEAYFDSLGLRRQRRIFGILLDTQAEAQAALTELQGGRSFDEVARQRSRHPFSAHLGGELGFVSRTQAQSLQIPDTLFTGLPDGEISKVLPQGDRFQIIRFDDSREAELDEHRIHIRNVIKTNELARLEGHRVEELAHRLHWHVLPEGLAVLERAGAGTSRVISWRIDAADAAERLFAYDGGEVTVAQYMSGLAAERSSGIDDSDALLVAEVVDTIRTAALLLEAARLAGFGESAEEQRWRDGLIVELAITELRRQFLRDAEPITAAQTRQFYDDHQDLFREADQMVLVEALVGSLQEAEDVMADVAGGQPLAGVAARRSTRGESLWQARGVLRLGHKERLLMPALYKAAQQVEPGQLTGPIAVKGGYSVFEVLDHQQGAMPSFTRVERRARALARRRQESERFEEFVDDLLERYDNVVSVYPEELVRALPDSLLERLSAG